MDFNSEYYIPEIEDSDFHLPHTQIIGKNHCAYRMYGMFVNLK